MNPTKQDVVKDSAARVPRVGTAHNPLLAFPRNHSCFCGSGEEFQFCCIKYQTQRIPKDWAERIQQCWKRLLSGELRIVPPKEAKRAEQQDPAMPDVPLVPGEEERVLAGTGEADDSAEPSDHRTSETDLDPDQGDRP